MIRNCTTPEGRELGQHMARFCDEAESRAKLKAPDILPRCRSCAFWSGLHIANGSPETQMGALKCVVEGVPFYCHDVHRNGQICSGWLILMLGGNNKRTKMWWYLVEGTSAAAEDYHRAVELREGQ